MPEMRVKKDEQLARNIVDTSCPGHLVGRGNSVAVHVHADTCTSGVCLLS